MNRKRNTTRILIGLLTCITVWFGTMSTVSAASGDNGSNELTIGVPSDRCPIFYQDADTHEIVGIGIDLMRIAAEEAGYTVTFQFIEEETLKDALDNEAYDVILPFGSPVSSTSGKPSVVSDNLMQTPFTLVTINKRKLPPFNELRVGMLRSLSAGAETVQALYPGIEILLYETMDDCVKALRDGEVDALLHNSYVWSYVLQNPPILIFRFSLLPFFPWISEPARLTPLRAK